MRIAGHAGGIRNIAGVTHFHMGIVGVWDWTFRVTIFVYTFMGRNALYIAVNLVILVIHFIIMLHKYVVQPGCMATSSHGVSYSDAESSGLSIRGRGTRSRRRRHPESS